MSGEFVTKLSGRYVSFQIRQFVYKEILEYSKYYKKDISISNYLIWGSFPKRLEFDNEENIKRYLNNLEETIIYKDSIKRFKIRKNRFILKKIVNYILINNSRLISTR